MLPYLIYPICHISAYLIHHHLFSKFSLVTSYDNNVIYSIVNAGQQVVRLCWWRLIPNSIYIQFKISKSYFICMTNLASIKIQTIEIAKFSVLQFASTNKTHFHCVHNYIVLITYCSLYCWPIWFLYQCTIK